VGGNTLVNFLGLLPWGRKGGEEPSATTGWGVALRTEEIGQSLGEEGVGRNIGKEAHEKCYGGIRKGVRKRRTI